MFTRILFILLITANLLLAARYILKPTAEVISDLNQKSIGLYAKDYVEYWSAAKLFVTGRPVYDPLAQKEVQNEIIAVDQAMMMWNPPWTVTMLLPVLNQPFGASLILWKILNLAVVFLIAVMVLRNCGFEKLMLGIAAVFSFTPLLLCFSLGQIGIIVALGVALFAYGISRKNELMTAVGAVIMTIKFHLFYLVWLVLLWTALKEKRYKLVLSGLLIFASLLALTEYIQSGVLLQWLGAMQSLRYDPLVTPSAAWVGPMLPHALSLILPESWGSFHQLFSVLIPGLIAAALFYGLITERISLSLERQLLPLLLISVWTAPFGWVFDVVVILFPLMVWLVSKSISACLVFLTIQLIATYSSRVHSYHHEYWWYMTVIVGLYFYLEIYKRKQTATVTV